MAEVVKEDGVVTDPNTGAVVTDPVTPKPGEKTDPALLLKSLQDERAEKKIERDGRLKAEAEIERLKSAPPQNGDDMSDEGRVLLEKITSIQGQLADQKNKEILTTLQTQFPALKDKGQEFQDYLNDPANAGVRLDIAAKAFLVDNELIGAPVRKGLEQPSGGQRAPVAVGMTPEEVDDLRVNNYRKYADMVRKGEIKFQ